MKKLFTLIAAAVTAMSLNAAEIFSFSVTATDNVSVEAGSDLSLADYAKIDGGTVTVHNGHASNAANLITAAGVIMTNSGGSYMKVVLDQPLEAGDKINVTMGSGSQCGVLVDVAGTKTKGSNKDGLDENSSYTVTAAEEGATVILFDRGSNNSVTRGAIAQIAIVRDNSKVKAPEIKLVEGKVVMTCATAGAIIVYSDIPEIDDLFDPEYEGPISVSETRDFYAMAVKSGMTNSDVVKFRVVKATGELGTDATFGCNFEAGAADEPFENIVAGAMVLTPQSGAVLSGSAPYESTTHEGVTFPGLVKVKGNLDLVASDAVITGLKIYGINNANEGTVQIKASGMECTTGCDLLRGREEITTPDVVELSVIEGPVSETTINFTTQARVKIEVYLTSADGVESVEAISLEAPKAKKVIKDGKVIVVSEKATYTVGAAQM